MNLAYLTVKRIVPEGEDVTSTQNRSKVGIFQGYVSITGNIILFGIKIVLGLASASLALIADAFHTLSDVVSSMVVIFGYHIARKPPDEEHPFGHGRAETIASLTIALLIGFVGFEFFKIAISRLMNPGIIEANWVWISAIALTIFIKEWMARYSFQLGDIIHSDTLKADGMHHKSDSYSSILTIVAMAGGIYGIVWLDGAMAIGVACFMLYTGYEIAKDAINDLLGTTESPEMILNIRETACMVDGVFNVHDIIVHRYGNHSFISLHVEVSNLLSSEEIHHIADSVEKKIGDHLNAQVVTHVDPITVDGETINEIREIVQDSMNSFGISDVVQDLRIVRNDKVESILFEIPVSTDFDNEEPLDNHVKNSLKAKYPEASIVVDFKKKFN